MRKNMRTDAHDTEATRLDSVIDVDSIIITNHARDRLNERWDSSCNADSTLHDALKNGVVETQNGSLIQEVHGSNPASIAVYIPSNHDLGLSRFILIERDDDYILVTIYPIEHRYVPWAISVKLVDDCYLERW